MTDTALLLIDYQRDFAAPDGAMARAGRDLSAVPAALESAAALLDGARGAGVLPVFVRLESADLCRPGTPGAAFFGLAPSSSDLVVTKPRYSAFTGTNLAANLKARGIATLVLAGLTTECCVASTAWHGLEQDFAIAIAADACAAYELGLHEQSLRALALSGAAVAPASDITTRWSKPL